MLNILSHAEEKNTLNKVNKILVNQRNIGGKYE